MKEFAIKCFVITICVILLFKFIDLKPQININAKFENKEEHNHQLNPYQYINEKTRFNQKTGKIECLQNLGDSFFQYAGKWVFNVWTDKEEIRDYSYIKGN